MLAQQLAHPTKDHLALLQERDNLASKEVHDGLGHDLQGQRVARIGLHQASALLGRAADLVLGQQLLARCGIQPPQMQRAHRRAVALQGAQGGGFLPAGQQQTTLVPRFGKPPQQVPIRFKARPQMPPHLAFC